MSTLTQKQRDAKAAEEARQRELERKALKQKGPKFGNDDSDRSSSSSSSDSDDDSEADADISAQVSL